MGEKGIHGAVLALACLVIVIFALQIAEETDASSKPTIVGTQVPILGPWNISEDTRIYDGMLNISKDVYVMRGIEVTFENVTLNIRPSEPDSYHEFVFKAEASATVIVKDSSLHLDTFMAVSQASLNFEQGSIIRTNGRFYGSCNSFFAEDTTFLNIAPGGEADKGGEDAIFIADGKVNSEFRNVRVVDRAGNAGKTSPGLDGKSGGISVLISNITAWIDCTIECTAGISAPGGLGLTGDSGGSGGQGADAEVRMRIRLLESCTVSVTASDGGNGAWGAPSMGGDAGNGGDGGRGGNVLLEIVGPGVLEIYNCSISSYAGSGGSGANGGSADDGNGGDGGDGDDGGDATLRIVGSDNINIEGTELTVIGGDGSYGGGYGRLESGEGEIGSLGLAGRGGLATLEVVGAFDLDVEGATFFAFGGSGYEGGAGYEQGEIGGAGGDCGIQVLSNGTMSVQEAEFKAAGGDGGGGGMSYSDILGNGGDGGDASIEFNRSPEMMFENFTIEVTGGLGGEGNSLPWDGFDGIATFDLDTEYLIMREGLLNRPLDDLHGDAEGYLYNVSFDLTFSIPVLPIGNAQVWTFFPVTVLVIDNPDPDKAKRLEGYEVIVIKVKNGATIDSPTTDNRGECHFWLMSFHYTSQSVNYEGSYLFIASTPDHKTSKKVRGEIQGPTVIPIIIQFRYNWLEIRISEPVDGSDQEFDVDRTFLEVYGYAISSEPDPITWISVHLFPNDDNLSSLPLHILVLSHVPLSELEDQEDKWGKYFPPEENSNRWQWFIRFEIVGGETEYSDGQYSLNVSAGDGFRTVTETVTVWLIIEGAHEFPHLELTSPGNGSVWIGPSVDISGMATSGHDIARIELSFDNDSWTSIAGQENWTYTMSTDVLGEGNHSVRVRAFDGEVFSLVVERWFVVQPDGPNGNGGGNGPDDGGLSTTDMALLTLAILLLILGVLGLVASRLRKSRPPPGEKQGW